MVNPTDSESVPAELDRYKKFLITSSILTTWTLPIVFREKWKRIRPRLSDDVVQVYTGDFEKNQISIQVVAKAIKTWRVMSLHQRMSTAYTLNLSIGLRINLRQRTNVVGCLTPPNVLQASSTNGRKSSNITKIISMAINTVFARKIAQNQFAKSQNGSPARQNTL